MKIFSIVIIIAFCLIFVPGRFADEGMWTFDNPPLKKWKEKYGFEPSREWLDHARLSTVRLSEGAGGGTGSFISADGLVFTNQHVGAGQVAKLSSGGRDLVKEGFYARTREEELKCPDLEVNVMVSYEDVTKRVQGAARPEASDTDAAAHRRAEMAAIEKDESAKTGLKCEVVTLYNGGEYWLYRFKRYTRCSAGILRPKNRSHISAAITTTLLFRATIWTSLSFASTKREGRRRSSII